MLFYRLLINREKTLIEGSEGNDWEGIVCPADPGHQRAGRRVTTLHLDIIRSKIVDFSSTMLSDVVITDHVLKVLNAEGLTGFTVKPTVTESCPKRLEQQSIPKLWEFVVTGKGGNAHRDSGIVLRRKCDACGFVRFSAYENGIIVDEATYDGSDFFTVTEYPTHILVNERAKSVLEKHRLTNVSFIESSELQWPVGVIKP